MLPCFFNRPKVSCAQIGHNDGLGHILPETTVTLFIRAHSAWLGPPHKLPRGGCVPGHCLQMMASFIEILQLNSKKYIF